ncbi:protein translocase subunit SecF [Psittacicella melopsittaci]|uniref:Protein-export membrane protein SecF n=1 Tax=Psittacicella melopsittaci TaxID=2028576 RepID=A0A3A1Y7R3_9GAMM|nr:protein translocase subunit SecF [Psittacicella melopsittaci]RIY33290.1 protein translocase subunit SecF [Psittacicella melopsittaci]
MSKHVENYTRGVDTPYPNRFSKKAYVTENGVVLARPIIHFLKERKYCYIFSAVLMIACIISFFVRGLNLGLDYTGGTVAEVSYSRAVTGPDINAILSETYPGIEVTSTGARETTIRIPAKLVTSTTTQELEKLLQEKVDPEARITSAEFVGPKAGSDLIYASVMSMLCTIIMMLLYISFRFQWRLSLGAVASLVHDVIAVIGIFSMFQIDIDLNFVAAILSVVGYSINDTIVVYDRMRENIRKMHRISVQECIDISLTETLNRTIMTSVTTLVSVVILLFFGGSSLYIFSLCLTIGIIIGTYSSVFVAVAISYDVGLTKEDMLVRQVNKDGLEEYER